MNIQVHQAEPQEIESMRWLYGQEMKRICYEAGKRPAARCNPNNIGSRRTLEKAGLLPCGRMLVGKVKQ